MLSQAAMSQTGELEPNNCFQEPIEMFTLCASTTIAGNVDPATDIDDVWFIDTTFEGSVTIEILSGTIELWIVSYWGPDTFAFCDGVFHAQVTPGSPGVVIPSYKDFLLGFFVTSTAGNTDYEIAVGFDGDFCGPCYTLEFVDNPINQNNYEASETIESNGTITTGNSVRFSAPAINLTPGFTVEPGAELNTDNTGCN